MAAYDRAYVVRTSWVFGIANNNFNKQVLNWASTRDKLSIVDDQVSAYRVAKELFMALKAEVVVINDTPVVEKELA